MSVLFFGAGAVGCTAGGWLSERRSDVVFYARGGTAEALRRDGLTLFRADAPQSRHTLSVAVTTTLDASVLPGFVVLSVKNYGLDAAARQVQQAFGPEVVVVGLQNGLENQQVLPRYFRRVVYGIVHYNAWVETPGVVGYQKKGPLVFGVGDAGAAGDLRAVAELFAPAVETIATDRLADAVHGKLIVNLANSLTTLVGCPQRPLDDPGLFQRLLAGVVSEAVAVVRAAGYREFRVPGTPSWLLMRAAARLPRFLTRRAFERNLRKMVMSSMAQDVVQRGGGDSELESINGRIVALADRHGLLARRNRALLALCRERFASTPFQPMGVREVWLRVSQAL